MYVAFTRCKEYLILLSLIDNNDDDMYSWYDFANFVMKQDFQTNIQIIH